MEEIALNVAVPNVCVPIHTPGALDDTFAAESETVELKNIATIVDADTTKFFKI